MISYTQAYWGWGEQGLIGLVFLFVCLFLILDFNHLPMIKFSIMYIGVLCACMCV